MKHLVYGLIDQRTRLVRYIGRSSSGLIRPNTHRRAHSLKHNNYKNHWLRQLFAAGYDYEIVVLEEANPEVLSQTESWWIAYGRFSGWPLTNLTSGGEGCVGRVMGPATRAKIGAANHGRVWTEESRLKAAAASAKVKPEDRLRALELARTPEAKAKVSAKLKGKPKTPQHAANLRAHLNKHRKPLTSCGTSGAYRRGCRCESCTVAMREQWARNSLAYLTRRRSK